MLSGFLDRRTFRKLSLKLQFALWTAVAPRAKRRTLSSPYHPKLHIFGEQHDGSSSILKDGSSPIAVKDKKRWFLSKGWDKWVWDASVLKYKGKASSRTVKLSRRHCKNEYTIAFRLWGLQVIIAWILGECDLIFLLSGQWSLKSPVLCMY